VTGSLQPSLVQFCSRLTLVSACENAEKEKQCHSKPDSKGYSEFLVLVKGGSDHQLE
jgi:hypothetical protein